MDGNRRWARKHGMPSVFGHREGVNMVEKVIKYCLEKGIKYLSLYTFSIENLKRSFEEKKFLFDLVADQAKNQLSKILEEGICVRFVGDRSLFPPHVKEVCDELEKKTADQKKIVVNFLFCYGGQQEIVAACKNILADVEQGIVKRDEITVDLFRTHLWTGHCPPPEVVIRTGGVKRLSNFLSFQAAYSELFFTETYWPAFTIEELDSIIEQYKNVQRNFGV